MQLESPVQIRFISFTAFIKQKSPHWNLNVVVKSIHYPQVINNIGICQNVILEQKQQKKVFFVDAKILFAKAKKILIWLNKVSSLFLFNSNIDMPQTHFL